MAKRHRATVGSMVVCSGAFGILVGITYWMFHKVYETQTTPYLDEIFHIPQAIKYCNGKFLEWDPKITTLPGLYLLSVGVLTPINYLLGTAASICNVYNLRLLNLFACTINFCLIYDIRTRVLHLDRLAFDADSWICAVAIWMFPVLHFFSFLYYTDTISTTLVLLMYDLHLAKRTHSAALISLVAVVVRQTNIVWVVFLLLNAMPEVITRNGPLKQGLYADSAKKLIYLKLLGKSLYKIWRGNVNQVVHFLEDCVSTVGGYIAVGAGFAVFLIINGGIVVGDKSAHEPTLHVMQLLYFTAFTTAFSCPVFVKEIPHFCQWVRKNGTTAFVVFVVMICLVHSNTIAHPYLLADNRHYVFYIWNRIYQRHILFPYCMVPFYMFSCYCTLRALQHTKIVFRVSLLLCVALSLVPQKLLEFRYFILPYMLFHVHLNVKARWPLFVEICLFLGINLFTVYIFVTKSFYWTDSDEAQRIIW